uniref:Fibronectin type-III domain-containing protein n=1 Tax=Leptobrachium leishanense TaxID=445787 RepID=A0A8C5PWZ3_9ANUR
MDSATIEMPSLGRPFSLGMLYDCRSDQLIPGVTLWNHDALNADVESKSQENTSFELIASDSISDKSSALNISASLKASFFGGLVSVGGSATYINDTKSSSHNARVTLKYSRTTRFDQLTMNHLGTQNMTYPEVFDKGTATHVVTGILYGAQAFFIFDREVSTSENIQDIQGNLQVMIKKIPSITIEGEGKLVMTDKEKESVSKFNCTFHGDFALERNPVTFEDAINTYANLPKLLGQKEEKAVPAKVWLYPLSKLDNRAAKLVREISNNLISKAENILQQMTDVNMQCNDLMRHPAAEIFPDIKRKIRHFREYCEQFTLVLQKQLAQTLPSIRGGGMEEAALVNILAGKDRSPFAKLHVEGYLGTKRQEMDIVSSYLKVLANVKVLPSENELNQVVTDPMVEFIVCFNFTSLNEEETYLSDLTNWLPILENLESKVYQPKTVTPWFKNTDIIRKARVYLRAFQEFTQANASREDTQYIISCTSDKKNPGVSIYLYEVGGLVSDCFLPPGKPSPPVIVSLSNDMVKLSLKPSDLGEEFLVGYSIEYRKQEEENWKTHRTENKDQEVNLTGLQANKTYQVRYSSMSKAGLSRASDNTVVKTLPASPPEIIKCTSESTYLHLLWREPKVIGEGATITEYNIAYKEGEHDNPTWLETRTGKKTENWVIEGLKPKTSYAIRVQAICGDHGTSAPSDEIEALTSDAQSSNIKYQLLKYSKLLTEGKPSVYELKTELSDSGYRKYRLGKENLSKTKKVILLVGATGTGKTTLINGIANYILGVDWKDDFRFKLIHEVTDKTQAHSQTSLVTAYEMNHATGYNIPYSLTLIDTPGFGDTRGIEQDKKVTEAIHAFFAGDHAIDQIDAVCFVVQAALARLTPTQKYIFSSVFSIFGKDIKDNILILINFSDGERPPVLEAIKTADIPCTQDSNGDPIHYKFNNSALFANNESSNVSFSEMFWTMGAHSMKTFFTYLNTTQSKSLRLTKEVLQERKRLEVTLQALQPQIKAGLVKLDAIRKTQASLKQNQDLMKANKDFEYEINVTVPVQEEVPHGLFITNCQQCHFTCHDNCAYADDKDKIHCSAMSNGNCTVCPNHCIWNVHFNQKYKWKYVNRKEKRTYEDLKKKFEEARGEVMTTEKMFQELNNEYTTVKEAVLTLISGSSKSLKRLHEIALVPNPLSTTEYIDLMIQSEEQEAKPGYKERIQSLKDVRLDAEIIEKIENGEELLPEKMLKYARIAGKTMSLFQKAENVLNSPLSKVCMAGEL